MFRPRPKSFFPFLFAILILIYIGRAATGGMLIFGSDTLSMWYFSRSFAFSSVSEGILPLWNPYVCSGMPFLAEPQSALFYPPNIIFYLLDTCRGLNISILLHIYLAWLFTYLLAKRMGMAPLPAAASGAAFSLSGFFMPRILGGHIPVLNAAVWLPAVFLSFDRCLRGKRPLPWAVLTGILLAFQGMGGHSQFAPYSIIILFLYLIYCLIRREARPARIAPASLCLVLAAGFAAVQILPTAELLRRSIRSKPRTYREATLISLPPENLVTLAVPDFFGGMDMIDTVTDLKGGQFRRAVSDQYWGRGIFWEMCPYVGVISLMLAVLAVRKLWRKNRFVPFLSILAVISIVISLGKYTPVYRLLFHAVPLLRAFECPSRALLAFIFSASLLAGLGLGQTLETARKPLRIRNIVIVAMIILAALAATMLLQAFWPDIIRASLYRGDRLTYLPGPYDEMFRRTAFERAGRGIITAAIWFSLGSVLLAGAFKKRLRGALIFIFITADLMVFGWKYSFGVKPGDFFWSREEVAALRKVVGGGRIINSTDLASLNEGALWRIPNICGFDPLILKRYNEYINLCRGIPVSKYTKILSIGSMRKDRERLLDLLGVSAVVLPRTVNAGGMHSPVSPDSGDNIVYSTANRLPAVLFPREVLIVDGGRNALAELSFPSFDPANTLVMEKADFPHTVEPVSEGAPEPAFSISNPNVNEIEIEVYSDRERFMLLSEIFYPGWRAYIDGKETAIYRADYIFRAVRVPGGDHTVRLRFDPASLKKGLAISLISCFAALIAIIISARRRI